MTNTLDIELRVKNLEASISKIKKDFSNTWNDVEKSLTNAGQKSASNITGAFAKVGTFIKWIFALAVFGQILTYGKQLIGLWSDLNEETSKLRTVFAWMWDQAIQTFNDLAEAQGRSRLDMIKYGATIGNIATSFGLAREQSLELSRSIVQLGTDIASFGNVSDDQGIGALRSALTWEFEPLKNLGYAINETDIKNKAFTLWLAKQGDELTRGQKLLAAYQLILDRTASAQGDAVRTGEGFANQLKRVQGTIKDTLAESGFAIAQQTAGTLSSVNSFIQKYGVSIISGIVEIGKSIWSVFVEIWNISADVLTALWVNLWEWGSSMDNFWRVTIRVIETLWMWLRATGFLFWVVAKFAVAAISDVVSIFSNVPRIIYKPFQAIGQIMVWFFENISNNMGVLIGKWINAVIGKVNGFISSMNKTLGTSIGTLNWVNEWVIKVWSSWKESLWSALDAQNELSSNLKTNSSDFSRYLLEWMSKLESANQASNERIKASNERAGKSMKDDLWKPLVSVSDLMKWLGNDAENSNNKQEKGAKKASEATKALEKNIDWVKKSYDKLKDEQENIHDKIIAIEKAHKKMTDTIKTWLRETTEKIQDLGKEYQANIGKIIEDAQWQTSSNTIDYIRSLAEQEAELNKEISQWWDDINQKLSERARIQEILNWFMLDNQELVKSERNRAGLSKQDRDLLDFKMNNADVKAEAEAKKKAEDEKYNAELDRLKRTQEVYRLFEWMQTTSVNNLNRLKTEELTKWLDSEQTALFEKLLSERLEYAQLIQDKTKMENDLHSHITDLSNQVTQIQKDNIASLSADYKTLVAQINEAISAARALQQVRTGNVQARVNGWPVTAGQPYVVWENADGSLNSTSELFVPSVSGTVVSAAQIRDAMQSANISNDNSRKIEIGSLTTQGWQDIERALERILFRL